MCALICAAMYLHSAEEQLAAASAVADAWTAADNARYAPYAQALEKLAVSRGCVFAGATVTALLRNEHVEFYEMFSRQPEHDAIAIGDALYSTGPLGFFTRVAARGVTSRVGPDKVASAYTVHVDTRLIAIVRLAPATAPLRELRAAGFSIRNLPCVPVKLALLDIYAQLRDPLLCDKWEAGLALERQLRDRLIESGKRNRASAEKKTIARSAGGADGSPELKEFAAPIANVFAATKLPQDAQRVARARAPGYSAYSVYARQAGGSGVALDTVALHNGRLALVESAFCALLLWWQERDDGRAYLATAREMCATESLEALLGSSYAGARTDPIAAEKLRKRERGSYQYEYYPARIYGHGQSDLD